MYILTYVFESESIQYNALWKMAWKRLSQREETFDFIIMSVCVKKGQAYIEFNNKLL